MPTTTVVSVGGVKGVGVSARRHDASSSSRAFVHPSHGRGPSSLPRLSGWHIRNPPPPSRAMHVTMSSSSSSTNEKSDLLIARDRLVDLSLELSSRSSSGKIFVTCASDVMKFRDEFDNFVAIAADADASASASASSTEMLIGDWRLIATANVPVRRGVVGRDGSRPPPPEGTGRATNFLDPIRSVIDGSFAVIQRIRNVGGDASTIGGTIDRVDNVIEFTPLETVDGLLPKDTPISSSALDRLLDIINPLKLTRAKVVLVHSAEVESTRPVLRVKIAWTSSVREYNMAIDAYSSFFFF
jgi:hypothetical protein